MTFDSSGPLKPEIFEILLALAEGVTHGYAIVQEVEANTAGRIRLAPSLLYRRLRRLTEEGLVADAGETGEGGRRHYRLTERGREVLRREARRVVELARERRIRDLAAGGPGALPT